MSSDKKITLEIDVLQYLYVIGEASMTKEKYGKSQDPVMKSHLEIVDGFLDACRAASVQVEIEDVERAMTELKKRGLQ